MQHKAGSADNKDVSGFRIGDRGLDLQKLAQHDPEAADVGYQLNHPQYGGANLDDNPLILHPQELAYAAPRFIRANPAFAAPIHRLRAYLTAPDAPPLSGGPALVTSTQVSQLGSGRDIDMMSAALPLSAERTLVVWDSGDEALSFMGLQAAVIDGAGKAVSRPQIPNAGQLAGSPSFVTINGQSFLYVAHGSSLHSEAKGVRYPVAPDGSLGSEQEVRWPPGVDSMLSWPEVSSAEGGLIVAYRDQHSRPLLARSTDGLNFEQARLVGPATGGAMAAAAAFGKQGVAFTYQAPERGEPMVSWLRLSTDGDNFDRPIRVSDLSSNVHDTALLPRDDGGVDMYTIYPAHSGGFSVFRRSVDEQGQFGPEQRVTDDSVGDAMKPSATKLADGRILLKFATGTERSPQGHPSRQRMDCVILEGEAPRA